MAAQEGVAAEDAHIVGVEHIAWQADLAKGGVGAGEAAGGTYIAQSVPTHAHPIVPVLAHFAGTQGHAVEAACDCGAHAAARVASSQRVPERAGLAQAGAGAGFAVLNRGAAEGATPCGSEVVAGGA